MDATRAIAGEATAAATPAAVLAFTVANPNPANGAERVAPGSTLAFELLGAHASSRVWDFEDGEVPPEVELCIPANGWSHADWNGGADAWDIYDDGGEKVLRAQGKATAIWNGATDRVGLATFVLDAVVRVRWYTDAQAGLVMMVRSDTYGKTNPISSYAAEIDSGGLRLIYYLNGTRNVRQTASFSPNSGTWYWIRLRVQTVTAWNHRYRAKYWTGTREAEPSSWSVSWEGDGLTQQPGTKHLGTGVRNNGSGDAYFDKLELVGAISPADAAKLTVEINGKVHSVAAGNLRVEPFAVYPATAATSALLPENAVGWYSVRGILPDLRRLKVEAFGRWAYDDDGSQVGVVKWDGTTVGIISWSTSSFPQASPLEVGAGDPNRIDGFSYNGELVDPTGRRFLWLLEVFPELMGRQDLKFAVAPIGWRAMAEEFRWIAIVWFSIPVDGEYTIAHPVEVLIPAGVIPGEVEEITIPAGVIPKGSLGELFPAGLVVQGYRRTDHPAGVVVGVRFFYRGKASGIVGEELLERIKASGIVLEVNADNELELQVMDEATYQALQALGVTWT
jgi:hypothetical protein